MSWIRHLAPRPTDYNPGQLQAETGAVAVNVVGDELAGYWVPGEEPTEAEWQAVVSAHVPQPDPPTAEERIAELEAVIAALLGD